MREPLVSVIIPVYNVENYISQCIESVINQSYINLEIIIVIDGSTDKSGEICESYERKDTRIRIIWQHNQGLSSARNKGILSSNGELICFVDSDDFIKKEMIERMVEAKTKNEAQMVVAGIIRYYNDKESYEQSIGIEKTFTTTEILKSILTEDLIGNYSCNKMVERSLFCNILFPEKKVYEDVYTMYKVISKCERIHVLSESFYYYRQRSDSITHIPSPKAFDDQLEGFISQADWISVHYPILKEVCDRKKLNTYLRMFDAGAAWRILDNNRLKIIQCGVTKYKAYYSLLSRKEKMWFIALTRFPYLYIYIRSMYFRIKYS